MGFDGSAVAAKPGAAGGYATSGAAKKMARQLPAGPESFGRGCLKGNFGITHVRLLCKCEISNDNCIFCNFVLKVR
jgi:hypothetical protein